MPDTTYSELEISLRRVGSVYEVGLQYASPDNAAMISPAWGSCELDPKALLPHQHDPQTYGEQLSTQLFQDEEIRKYFADSTTQAKAKRQLLRLSLQLDPKAPELQPVRWELLTDPENKEPLATSAKTPFSRWMFSGDMRPVRLRARDRDDELKALVAVSAPLGIEAYNFAPVDRDGELARVCRSLEGIKVTTLGDRTPVTLEKLTECLLEEIDILYLVAHGRFVPGKGAVLYLQNDAGETAAIQAAELAKRVKELNELPRLAVLASCESAGKEDTTPQAASEPAAHAALAPQLAAAGIPAILAMQGQITMKTVEECMPVFFSELLKDGQIDRALAVARGIVRNRPDRWMLALFLRLRRGRIWYEPGFAGSDREEDQFKKWKSVCNEVRLGSFIPIIGPDVGEHVFGTTGELARQLASDHQAPLAHHERSDLAKVSQYLSVSQSHKYARDQVEVEWRRQLVSHNPTAFGDSGNGGAQEQLVDLRKPFAGLLAPVVAQARAEAKHAAGPSGETRVTPKEHDDPYRLLARLPAHVYVNASPDTLLYEHLKAAGCQSA